MSEKKPRVLWKLFFVLSLALNLLLIGLIGGSIWTSSVSSSLKRAQTEFLSVLPEEKRPAMEKIFQDHYTRSRPHRWQMFWRYRKAIKEMEAENFDSKRFEELIAQISQTHTSLVKLRYQLVIDTAKGLNYEERKAFVRIFRKRVRQLKKLEAKNN